MKKLDKNNIEDILSLTPMQEGMLFHYLKDPDSDAYFEQLSLNISGEIDVKTFEKAWNFVIEINEMLRAVFRWEKVDNPIQVILKEHRIQPKYYDFSGTGLKELKNPLEEVKVKDRAHKFDLREVPFRVTLCKIQEDKHEMIISNHHILYDGWSNGIILKEFFNAYNDLYSGKELVKPVKSRYKEFIQYIQSRDMDAQEKFWKEYLSGFDTQTGLSIKRVKEIGITSTGECQKYRIQIEKDFYTNLEGFVNKHKLTLASLLYTAWGILLQKYNSTADVMFGTTVSGRPAKIQGMERIVGLFINTVPLRVRTFLGEKIGDLLYRVDNELKTRGENEQTPLIKIKEYSEIDGQEEFFDSIVIIENYPLNSRLMLGKSKSSLYVDTYSMAEMTHYDLTVEITIFENIDFTLIYKKELLDEKTIVRLANHFGCILDNIINNPGKEASGIEIISEKEKKKILYEFNNTGVDYPKEKTVHQLFEEQVKKAPNKAAVSYKDKQLTYKELNKRANQLARILRLNGVKAESFVGLMPKRSIEMVIGMVAILKAGGAYIPIGPEYPEERITHILKECGTKILLTNGNARLFGDTPLFINLDSIKNTKEDDSNLPSLCGGTGLVYVIYTSGTTGRPKGVMIENKNVINFIKGITAIIPFTGCDRILSLTTISFDIFGLETILPLTKGSEVVIGTIEDQLDAHAIAALIKRKNITIFQLTPSRLKLIISDNESSRSLRILKYLLVGGEIFPERLLEETKAVVQGKIFNLYGPTETTIWSAAKDVSRGNSLNIGKPIANTRIYILNKDGLVQPIGVPGELCISGAGVGRGYFKNDLLTKEKFIENPFVPGEKMYKTGDLAKWLLDGNIEFLGRIDHQVKIRGFRIELGEIESQLLKNEKIKEVVVIPGVNEKGDEDICAYIVIEDAAVSDKAIDAGELRAYLARKVPGYMIPSHYVRLDEIPLTPSGKVNRNALPSLGTTLSTGSKYASPGSDIEKKIAAIWEELLHRDKVSIHDHFFDIGGNSLLMIRLSSRLTEVFKKDIPIVTLFNHPTIAALARHLAREETGGYIDTAADKARRDEIKAGKQRLKELIYNDTRSEIGEEYNEKGLGIAVIGMSGRFPGANDCDEFWENLKNGVECITFFTNEELVQRGVESMLVNGPDYVGAKGVLEGKAYFDSSFFDYTPGEAVIMDPQVRIFHECTWEALENSGYDSEKYDGIIGLYAGASSNPLWGILQMGSGSRSFMQQWEAIQLSDKDYLTTRVAYKLGLKGPCITVQTACSTSLVAIDLACRGLLSGACDMALAGGVSITLHDEVGYQYQEGSIMSPDGHCRAFDAGAKGTVGGNGAAVVVLKHLEKAMTDGDTIHAVIKGFGTNNDGNDKVGFTAPGIKGQAEAVRAALQMAGVGSESIGYIEAHGSGTTLGDPIEIEALKFAFNTMNSRKRKYCAIGSVKTNIGHLDTAAGVAGFIKTVLMLKHRLIPPSINFKTPNPKIDFENSPFYVITQLVEWKRNGYPLRAGVSSFGIGGTNAHVVLEEAPEIEYSSGSNPWELLLLSAKTKSSLQCTAENLQKFLIQHPDINFADVAYTLQLGRREFPYRQVLVCADVANAIDALSAKVLEKKSIFCAKEEKKPVIFMFPGIGAQYVNMGLEIYQTEPVFREEMDRCFEILKTLMGYDIKEIIYPQTSFSKVNKVNGVDWQDGKPGKWEEIAQIAVFIIEYALARLLIKWGIKPDAIIGYSFGEYTAACLSGVFSLEDALKLIVLRSHLIEETPPGAMLSVPLAVQDLQPLLEESGLPLSLAIDNGPSCVVSGPAETIEAFEKQMKEKRYLCVRLQHARRAIHSHMMAPIAKRYQEVVARFTLKNPHIPYISNVTGRWAETGEVAEPAYWAKHLQGTVRFAAGVKQLLKKPGSIFIEIGPGYDLSVLVRHHVNNDSDTLILNLVDHARSQTSASRYLLNKVGRLWLSGVPIDWSRWYTKEKRTRISLPNYPFEKQHYWFDGDPFKICAAILAGTSKPEKKTDIADWFYIPSWKRSILPQPEDRECFGTKCWLVFRDESSFSDQLVNTLRENGQDVITVSQGMGFKEVNRQEYVINPGRFPDYSDLFNEFGKIGKTPGKIVHLWSVTGNEGYSAGRSPGANRFHWTDKSLETGFYSLLFFAKASGKQSYSNPMEIVMVSNHLQRVTGDEKLHPEKAVLLGAVKVIPLEYPNINCRSIDIVIPAGKNKNLQSLVNRILKEFSIKSPDTVIAYRGNYRWVQVFEPIRLDMPGHRKSPLKENGVYLVTGGLGGIGFALAEHLAKKVRAKLVLTGRSRFPHPGEWDQWLDTHEPNDPTSRKIEKVKALEKLGAEVLVCSADVAELEQMQQVINRAAERFGRINGVIHAAGIPDGCIIPLRTRKTTDKVMAAKIKGTLVLDGILKNMKPDFFVNCSSISIITGAFGQAGYCAANAFQDAFARWNTEENGIFTLAIDWDVWKEVGFGVEAIEKLVESGNIGEAQTLLDRGILPAEGVKVFERLLNFSYPQVAVSSLDLKSILEKRENSTAVVPRGGDSESGIFTRTKKHPRPELSTEYVMPKTEFEKTAAAILQDLLGVESVGIHDNFFEFGITSLTMIHINRILTEKIKREIPLVVMFEYPTIHSLGQYLCQAENGVKEQPENLEKMGGLLHQSINMLRDNIK